MDLTEYTLKEDFIEQIKTLTTEYLNYHLKIRHQTELLRVKCREVIREVTCMSHSYDFLARRDTQNAYARPLRSPGRTVIQCSKTPRQGL